MIRDKSDDASARLVEDDMSHDSKAK